MILGEEGGGSVNLGLGEYHGTGGFDSSSLAGGMSQKLSGALGPKWKHGEAATRLRKRKEQTGKIEQVVGASTPFHRRKVSALLPALGRFQD